MNKLFILVVGLCACIYVNAQQTIDLVSGNITNGITGTVPTRDVRTVTNGIEVTYTFSQAISLVDEVYPSARTLKIDGFGQNGIIGEPATLFRWDTFAVPSNHSVSVTVIDSSFINIPMELSPAKPPLTDSGNEVYSTANVPPITAFNGVFPKKIISETAIQSYRGNDMLKVCVCPIKYNYTQQTVTTFNSITYKVTFVPSGHMSAPAENVSVNPFDNFICNTTLNSSSSPNLSPSGSATLSLMDYLIISVPDYSEAVNRFAEWKKTLGFRVTTMLKDTWTPEEIKDSVSSLYSSPNKSLYFLLIVGDHEDVPGGMATFGTDQFVTDLYYGCMGDSSDYTPDIYRGRLSVSSNEEANVIVDKIIQYEKKPVQDTTFYNTGLNCAYFQDDDNDGYADTRFVETSEEIRDYIISLGKNVTRIYMAKPNVTPMHWNHGDFGLGGILPEELRYPNFAWDGDASDIANGINYGAFYVLYRGHGYETVWFNPRYTVSNINNLTNANRLPVIFSTTCHTGKYNDRTCFAESFHRKENGGCVAIFAATEKSYSGFNDALSIGMIDAIWPDPGLRIKFFCRPSHMTSTPLPTYRLGQILDQGMQRMEETWPRLKQDKPYTIYTREVFHCFGDPSMRIYTELPTVFENISITRNSGNITVATGLTNTCISFYNRSTGDVVAYTGANATYNGNSDDVVVCVSAHNKIPYIDDPDVLYIQDETIDGPKSFNSNFIKVGENVTNMKATGEVIFKSGNISLNGNTVELDKGTTISKGANVEINP